MIFDIVDSKNTCYPEPKNPGVYFVVPNCKWCGSDAWEMLESAFPNHRAPGLAYYGLYHFGQYENAIFFPR